MTAAEHLLGEMVAIVAMLAQGIKLDGSVMLQIRGNAVGENGDGRMRRSHDAARHPAGR